MATNDDSGKVEAGEITSLASSDTVAEIRKMLSRAVRAKRSQQAGDLMPDVRYFLFFT